MQHVLRCSLFIFVYCCLRQYHISFYPGFDHHDFLPGLRSEKSGYVWLSVFHPSSARCHLSQEIAIAMRSNRGPVAMTETGGELLHLPLGFPVNPSEPHGHAMALGSPSHTKPQLQLDAFDII